MPRTTPKTGKRPQRRVNPHSAPWDTLPIITFHPDHEAIKARDAAQLRDTDWEDWDLTPLGTIEVIRGDFNIDDIDTSWLTGMAERPGVEHVIQTDAFGRMRILPAGFLIDAELADTNPADTGYPPRVEMPTLSRDVGSTLTDWAAQLREHARRALEVADTYDALAADGWELVPTQPAPGYYPPPLRRTRPSAAWQDQS